jgi:hypothetical protein
MYTGSLPTISNRADWKFEIGLTDSDTGETIDFTGCTIEIDVRDDNRCIVLHGTTSDKISIPQIGVAQISFTPADVRNLCAGSYSAGITITGNGETMQLFAGSVSVVDGVVQ